MHVACSLSIARSRRFSLLCPIILYIGSVARYSAYYGTGSGPILLSNLYCTGSEENLLQCNRNMYGTLSCSHSQDAGVICEGQSVTTAVLTNIHRCTCTQFLALTEMSVWSKTMLALEGLKYA